MSRNGFYKAQEFEVEEESDDETEQKEIEESGIDQQDEENLTEDTKVESDEDYDMVPLKYVATLKKHTRPVCAIDIDHSGYRMVSGGYEYGVKLWDFNGMDDKYQHFRFFDPWENTQLVKDIKFNKLGNRMLIVSGDPSAKLFDNEGKELLKFLPGDPYVRDKRNTYGHTHNLTSCDWNPIDNTKFLTSSIDTTIRFWDVTKNKSQSVIQVKAKKAGDKTLITTCRFNPDASLVACGSLDGGLRLFSTKGPTVFPKLFAPNAHLQGKEVTSVAFSGDGNSLLSRSCDHTMKLWDIRKFTAPVVTFDGLFSAYSETSCLFSPDGRFAVTGTGIRSLQEDEYGRVCLFDIKTSNLVYETKLHHLSVCKVLWNARLNQIFTGNSDGSISAFYDPKVSFKGVVECVDKHFKAKTESYVDAQEDAYAPHALPMFRAPDPKKAEIKRRYYGEPQNNPFNNTRPTMPHRDLTQKNDLTHRVLLQRVRDITRDQDPREEILKFAKLAEEDPIYVYPAYKDTQPKPIFQEGEYEEYESLRLGQAEKKAETNK